MEIDDTKNIIKHYAFLTSAIGDCAVSGSSKIVHVVIATVFNIYVKTVVAVNAKTVDAYLANNISFCHRWMATV